MAILRTAWAGIAALLAAVALTGARAGTRRRVRRALAARDLVAPPARPGDGGRVLRLRQEAGVGGRAHGGRRLPRARARPPDVRDLRRRAPGRLRRRAARAGARRAGARRGWARVRPRPRGGVAAWLAPIVQDTASHSPSAAERARGLAHYPGQVDVFSPDSFRLAPEMLGRAGAVAIAALVAVPLAAFASRRRWSAYVLGGLGGDARDPPRAAALHAVLGCRLAVAGAARGRLRAARGGIRRGSGRARAARVVVGHPRGAGGGDRARARVPGGVHVSPGRGRARRSRPGSRSSAARSRSSSPPCSARGERATTVGRCRRPSPGRSSCRWRSSASATGRRRRTSPPR